MQHRQRRGLHQPIEPEAEEADVVAAADIVDAGISHLGQILHGGIPALVEQARRREHADPEGWRAIGLCGIRHISTGRLWIVLPALLPRFCGGAGVGSGAWVPA